MRRRGVHSVKMKEPKNIIFGALFCIIQNYSETIYDRNLIIFITKYSRDFLSDFFYAHRVFSHLCYIILFIYTITVEYVSIKKVVALSFFLIYSLCRAPPLI